MIWDISFFVQFLFVSKMMHEKNRINVQLGQVSSKFAGVKNGQINSKFAAVKKGQVSSKLAAAKMIKLHVAINWLPRQQKTVKLAVNLLQ